MNMGLTHNPTPMQEKIILKRLIKTGFSNKKKLVVFYNRTRNTVANFLYFITTAVMIYQSSAPSVSLL